MLRFDLPAVSANVIRWEAVITFIVCNLALFVSPWFMAIQVAQAFIKGFIGHYKCPSHLLWKRVFDAQGWTGAMVNAGAKMFAAKILFLASAISLVLFLLGNELWKVPCVILIVFSFLEWALSFCAACWVYGFWYRIIKKKMG